MRRITIMLLLFAVPVSARVVIIPTDYETIQEGIDSCTDGDTVLVKPGTYYENINFNGHNIVVASFFLTTGNAEYISNTIIDGDSSGSVVTFENGEDSTATITGFTLKNGYNWHGGGIFCEDSDPLIAHNIIKENSASYSSNGGGIHCSYSNARVIRNTILENYGCYGGGINCENSSLIIRDNIISGNEANP